MRTLVKHAITRLLLGSGCIVKRVLRVVVIVVMVRVMLLFFRELVQY